MRFDQVKALVVVFRDACAGFAVELSVSGALPGKGLS